MNAKGIVTVFLTLLLILPIGLSHSANAADEAVTRKEKKIEMDIGINKEDRDVGLKRMEIIDKALSPELMERKRALVHSVEQDYNTKIAQLLERLTTPIGRNTVVTHLDVNFFSPDFESEVNASQTASVSIILGRDGFDKWGAAFSSEEEAVEQLRSMITTTFKIPEEGVSIIVAPH
ncbi:MAG: hypothetical protein ACMUIS_02325 [bacterium]